MDYEKKYNEALERAREWYVANTNEGYRGIFEEIFPELKESEDDKIRKEILDYIIKGSESYYDIQQYGRGKFGKWITWLEKQGEKNKLIEDKDKLIKELGEYKVKYTQEVLETHLNSMSNKDDERLRKITIAFLKDFADKGYENAVECIAWLEKQDEKKELNLVEILKHYPEETELYSPLYGKLWLAEVDEENEIITCYKYPLNKGGERAILEQENTISFYSDGTTGLPDCTIS